MTSKKMALVACVAMLMGIHTMAPAGAPTNVELATVMQSVENVFTPGTEFTVRVIVTVNDSGQTPSHAALRWNYDTANVSFVSASGMSSDGWLGTVDSMAVGAEETVSGTMVTRDIPTLGNFTNTDLTPEIMDVTFEVAATPNASFDITFGLDPGVSMGANSFLSTMAAPIAVTNIDNSASLGITPPVSSVDDWMVLAD